MTDSLPLIECLSPAIDSEAAFQRLCHLPHCLFLDSAQRDSNLGRYSFLTADPFEFVEFSTGSSGSLAKVERLLERFSTAAVEGIPPFQGGAAGLFGYDLNRELERIPAARFDEFGVPAVALGLYDIVIAFDHQAGTTCIISQGWPEVGDRSRRKRAEQRLAKFKNLLTSPFIAPQAMDAGHPVMASMLAPQFEVPGPKGLTSTYSAEAYKRAVERAVEYIYAGDIFQVNLSQRLLFPAQSNPLELYLRLRRRNPATFAGYFDTGEFQIVSASPERFLRVRSGEVETRPIKGTRQRIPHPEADLFAGDDLLQSEKDRAENVMIVDLLRNDLSRVCRPDSVQVTQLCGLEHYQYVQHLVSVVCGELDQGKTVWDLMRAAFPGGSITGAPKVRAMEIIAELEPTARGAYCGCLGYVGFNGDVDLSILIRTITVGRGWWQFPVGGGIVAQSNSLEEYAETWHKAAGLIRALTP